MGGRRDYQADGLRQSHNAKVCVFDPDKFVNSHCCVVFVFAGNRWEYEGS